MSDAAPVVDRALESATVFASWSGKHRGMVRDVAACGVVLERLLREAGLTARPVVLVTGSKGKGETATACAAELTARGLRAGLVTSPGIVSSLDRFALDGVPVSAERYHRWLHRLDRVLQALGGVRSGNGPGAFPGEGRYLAPTGLFTVLGHAMLAEAGADVVVHEAGMGGANDEISLFAGWTQRVSATGNGTRGPAALDAAALGSGGLGSGELGSGGLGPAALGPAASAVDPEDARPDPPGLVRAVGFTQVFAEHLDVFGPTLADVAAEKFGLVTGAAPVASVEQDPEIAGMLRHRCRAHGATLRVLPRSPDFSADHRALAKVLAEAVLATELPLLDPRGPSAGTPAPSGAGPTPDRPAPAIRLHRPGRGSRHRLLGGPQLVVDACIDPRGLARALDRLPDPDRDEVFWSVPLTKDLPGIAAVLERRRARHGGAHHYVLLGTDHLDYRPDAPELRGLSVLDEAQLWDRLAGLPEERTVLLAGTITFGSRALARLGVRIRRLYEVCGGEVSGRGVRGTEVSGGGSRRAGPRCGAGAGGGVSEE